MGCHQHSGDSNSHLPLSHHNTFPTSCLDSCSPFSHTRTPPASFLLNHNQKGFFREEKIVPSGSKTFLPAWNDSYQQSTWQLPLLSSNRCSGPLRFSGLAQWIQILGYSTGGSLPSGLWDTDHKPLGTALQTFLGPPRWALTQPGCA